MKRITKILSIIIVSFICVFTLTSCDNQISVYKAFSNNGSELTKSHVFTEVSYKKIISILDDAKETGSEDNKIYTYVFYGTPTSSSSCTAIQVYNEQAKQFEINTVYYLDSDLSDKQLTKIKEAFGMKKQKKVPSIFVFINGKLAFDSTETKYDDMETSTIATKAFRDTK